MRKGEMKNEWQEEDIRQFLLESAGEELIPDSLHPDKMKEWLRQQTKETEGPMGRRKDRISEEFMVTQKERMEEEPVVTQEERMEEEPVVTQEERMEEEPVVIQEERMEEEPVVTQKERKAEESMEDQEKKEQKRPAGKRVKYISLWCGTFAAAACLVLVLFATVRNIGGDTSRDGDDLAMKEDAAADDADIEEGEFQEGTTYAKLYQSFGRYWSEQEELYRMETAESADVAVDDAAAGEVAGSGGEDVNDAVMDAAASDTSYSEGGISETVLDKGGDSDMSGPVASGEDVGQKEDGAEDYGKTNQQEEAVEEADIIKNDGRYLYRVVERGESNLGYSVRIVDTKDGLKEASMVGDFEIVQNIYVWEDKLVVLEPGWAMNGDSGTEEMSTGAEIADADLEPSYPYCRIHVYDISDRTSPQEYHTFTVKGSYLDSRISGGYLYFFALCDTSKPEKADDLKMYVPMMDGKPMSEDKITLPGGSNTASYLVMASVDMARPDTFTDTRALVASEDRLYVSQENIYLADTQYASYNEEGNQSDSTTLYRFSYKDGKMRKEAMGKVKGTLRDDMAMNEYDGYLRLVTTVQSQNVTKVIDDISGEFLGYDDIESRMTNSLYVLDSNLKTVGKIEDIAPDERIYSARFMGKSGYFVTFRETDPLFSVDLSNPREPKVLGELKISGFSEYLHFYADNLLLGIGMEADEKTGTTECIKLSMFDISNPQDVKEQSKLLLSEFDYSEALYNYKAVLIDAKKNLFGFCADDYYGDDSRTVYMLFTFKDGNFAKVMEIDCSDYERYGYEVRGTYIGERFFLFAENGVVEEYGLADGRKVATLEP